MVERTGVRLEVLPIPGRPCLGLITFDGKDRVLEPPGRGRGRLDRAARPLALLLLEILVRPVVARARQHGDEAVPA
ncbi:hypothetical protein [Rhodococcus sp. ACPA1]|uniref:hypothetical protein n=1 Tax=Rhodococcus sp. ACPA1 TaxID=2028572 RepID=UPI000BB0FBBF|nr:hypothetical protein [Rhodococcus sp. ACPA1]PBC47323.1 hypothetical protein CJ177_44415 [Rhodococcus sp. ACPA1]